MAENSKIEWTHHTFNPWIGCTKVSPACDHCYAEAWDKRYEGGKHWGPKAERRRTGEKNWNQPIKWNRVAEEQGIRLRVFCASLADVFDNQVPQEWREDLYNLIKATPHLDWLLLTKRPQNIKKMLPADWEYGYKNVWLGTTVENQVEADRRIPHLLSNKAKVKFLSCEPLLGPVDLGKFIFPFSDNCGLNWVITGGESGPEFRHAEPDWFRSLRDQCKVRGVAFLFKQWEGKTSADIKKLGRELDGVVWNGYPK